jgi:hypothetical protein
VATVEVFDPRTSAWGVAGTLQVPRYQGDAIALDDGRILLVGGYDKSNAATPAIEIFDPATGRSTLGTPRPRTFLDSTAVRYQDGVVAIGGLPMRGGHGRMVHHYDVQRDRWTELPDLPEPVDVVEGFVLPDGWILLVGDAPTLYDPRSGRTQRVRPRSCGAGQAAGCVQLGDGSVLVTGGCHYDLTPVVDCDRFDVAQQAFVPVAPLPGPARNSQRVCRLSDGTIVTLGGWYREQGPPSRTLGDAAVFHPGGGWTAVADTMQPVVFHTATVLPDDRILIAGGYLCGLTEGHAQATAVADVVTVSG